MALETSNIQTHWDHQSYYVKFILSEFADRYFDNIFVRNKDVLEYNSDKVKFEKDSWTYNPIQFCQDYYGEQYLYQLVLLVNNIDSMFSFYSEKLNGEILAPTLDIISQIIKNRGTLGMQMSVLEFV